MALDSSIPLLELALEGKIDFLKKTNPWGSSKDDDINKEILSQEDVAKKLQAWALGMSGRKRDRREPLKKEGIVLPEGMSLADIPGASRIK